MNEKIYKIVTQDEWDEAVTTGIFKGAPIDLEDGYIHFSTAEQVEETAAKHFHGRKNLLLITADSNEFGDALKWEPSRGGNLFPHLYASLRTDQATQVSVLVDQPDGSHIFPENF
ncbi:MAG: DUF952 domain-containing protein [Pseudomonadota bacterium]